MGLAFRERLRQRDKKYPLCVLGQQMPSLSRRTKARSFETKDSIFYDIHGMYIYRIQTVFLLFITVQVYIIITDAFIHLFSKTDLCKMLTEECFSFIAVKYTVRTLFPRNIKNYRGRVREPTNYSRKTNFYASILKSFC